MPRKKKKRREKANQASHPAQKPQTKQTKSPKHDEPIELSNFGEKSVVMSFDGPPITNFGGLLLLIEFSKLFNFFADLAKLIPDVRTSDQVHHKVETLCSQTILADIAGYHLFSDHDDLRDDPAFHLIVKLPGHSKHGFHPKIPADGAELERYIAGFQTDGSTNEEIDQLRIKTCEFLTEKYADSFETAPKSINLELASSIIRLYRDL